MPWVSLSALAVPPGGVQPYKFLFLSSPPGTNQIGVSLESDGTGLLGRLRVGFYYPAISAGGRIVLGSCVEMQGASGVGATPIHTVGYGFATAGFLAAATDEVYGVAIAVDRGVIGASARLWRFT